MKKQRSIFFFATIFITLSLTACASSYERYEDAETYSIGNFSYTASEVKEIEIDWKGGSIEIQQGQSDTISGFEESLTRSETQKMHHLLKEGTLKIEYCASGYKGDINENEKNLQLEIPKEIALRIETKDASVSVGMIEVRSLSIESNSGDVTGEKWTVDREVEIETDSGFVSIGELNAENLDFESKSGGLSVEKCNLRQIDGEAKGGDIKLGLIGKCIGSLETTSGNVTLKLLEETGLGVRFKSFMGDLKTEREYQKENRYLFTGKSEENYWQIGVDTVSGNLYVE